MIAPGIERPLMLEVFGLMNQKKSSAIQSRLLAPWRNFMTKKTETSGFKDDGRSAFPRPVVHREDGEILDHGSDGMTYRQWLAGQVIIAIASEDGYDNEKWPHNVAGDAVKVADALIAELDKTS